MKNILFFDHTAAMGGGEIALLHLVERLDPERFHPVVVLASPGPLHDKLAGVGVETHLLPLASDLARTRKDSLGARSLLQVATILRAFLYALRLARLIRRLRIDLVHTNSLKADLIGGLAARLARVPLVWHIRDRIDEDYLPRKVVSVFRWLLRKIPDCVIANSAATLRTLKLPVGAKSYVVASGVVHDGAAPARSFVSGRPDADAPLIGIIGRISPWKGQHIFLRAAAIVRERFPRARFQIIGSALFNESDYENQIRELVVTLGLQDAVELTGFRSDVPALIQQLDFLAHASTTGEPFGQVVAEGMIAGKPVVASNGGGVVEIIEDGVSGLLVPMGDSVALAAALISLIQNPEKTRAMARAGRERILQHFTIEQTVRKVQGIYDDLLAHGRDEAAPADGGSAPIQPRVPPILN